MSVDFQFISVVDDLEVTRVTEVVGSVPRTIRVEGRGGFRSAQRVEVNNFGVDVFTVASDTVLFVVPGQTFVAVPVDDMEVVVVSGELSNRRKARLIFAPTQQTRQISGLQKLVQQVVKSLLSNTGSNRFNPNEGGNVMQSVGKAMSAGGESDIAADISNAVSDVKQQFLAGQAGQRGLRATERLLNLELTGVQFDSSVGLVTAQIRLVTFAGQSLDLPLQL